MKSVSIAVANVQKLAEQGKIRIEIARELGISYSYVSHIVESNNIKVKGKLQRNLEKIRELAQQNKTREEIAREMNLGARYVSQISSTGEIKINNKLKRDIEKIRPYVESMHVSVSDAMKILKRKKITAAYVLRAVDGMRISERLNYWLQREMEQGRSPKEISNLLGKTEYSLSVRCVNFKDKLNGNDVALNDDEIERLKRNLNPKQIQEVDCILSGDKITEIGNKFGYSRQAAQQKIKRYGLYGNWIIARNKSRDYVLETIDDKVA